MRFPWPLLSMPRLQQLYKSKCLALQQGWTTRGLMVEVAVRDLGRNYPTWYMPIAVSYATERGRTNLPTLELMHDQSQRQKVDV